MLTMLTAMIPVCSLAINPEPGRCDRNNACRTPGAGAIRRQSCVCGSHVYDERPTYFARTANGRDIGKGEQVIRTGTRNVGGRG